MTPLRPIDRWFIDEILPHEALFLRAARRVTGSRGEAEDLVQEAYCRLFEGNGWALSLDPRAYTIQTIRNLAMSQMRRARIVEFSQLIETENLAVPDESPDAFRIAAGREAVMRAGKALDAMPERCRHAVVQCRVQGETPTQVAAAAGLSLSTLEKRLTRGLKLLAAALYPAPVDKPDPTTEPKPVSACPVDMAGQADGGATYSRHASSTAER
ncbi:sigma-70 family RNA polymerase sigma factor [Sphingomonas sp. AP4-R1]|uniref:RNA polymerase sigma factor n=1 Tax=Sphingomonas sp. AP4-R1 TaxID=2735134 RepID=UPI001493CD57|nr:sigma-70 family RNA polymerase sigma factor [Sphingomonas sp. AP4-R1]QJU60156.1 sigma-70 family RNA polymerase sigma factor [Sphingomonas sp. AP4-R1]